MCDLNSYHVHIFIVVDVVVDFWLQFLNSGGNAIGVASPYKGHSFRYVYKGIENFIITFFEIEFGPYQSFVIKPV